MRGCVAAALGMALSIALAGSALAAEVVPWLYEVAVPVESQSPQARETASGQALLELLSRLTGLAHVPRTEQVAQALARPDAYYNEFRYASLGSDLALELIIHFEPSQVLGLIRRSELPLWRSSRQRVVAWVVLEDDSGRRLLGSTLDVPATQSLQQRARQRGVPLTLPLLDLEDQLNVSAGAVWGRLGQVLEPASKRYAADLLLMGRIRQSMDGSWTSDWEIWLDATVLEFVGSGEDLEAQMVEAIDWLANELAAREVVTGRVAEALQIAVEGIRTPGDYGELLGYLHTLEFVDAVDIMQVKGTRIVMSVITRARAEQLLMLFESDNRLFQDQLAVTNAADLNLVWRQL